MDLGKSHRSPNIYCSVASSTFLQVDGRLASTDTEANERSLSFESTMSQIRGYMASTQSCLIFKEVGIKLCSITEMADLETGDTHGSHFSLQVFGVTNDWNRIQQNRNENISVSSH